MNASEFYELNQSTKLQMVSAALKEFPLPHVVFGPDAQKTYKKLAKIVHPDMGGTDEAFHNLTVLWEHANAQMALGEYGKTPGVVGIEIEGIVYALRKKLGSGDTCDVWLTDGDNIVKILRDKADVDLLDSEVQHLRRMADAVLKDEHDIPEVVAFDAEGAVYHYNTEFLCLPEQLVTLEKLAEDYHHALPVKAIGWLWRRILGSLMRPHTLGIVHAGLTPENILVDVYNHRIVVIDWKFASINESVIDTIPDEWADLYPPEVMAREKPTPAIDVYMAAKDMLFSNTAMPEPMKTYFEALTGKWGTVPYDLSQLMSIWSTVIYDHLGWKREFVILDYDPVELDWSWFW